METINKMRIGAVAIVLAGFLLIGYLGRPSANPEVNYELGGAGTNTATNEPTNAGTNAAPEPTPGAKEFTAAEVAAHPDAKSCWVSIDGAVYDVTEWVPMHPGGAKRILDVCGKDGTQAFSRQHGMDQRALDLLPNYKIGSLKK